MLEDMDPNIIEDTLLNHYHDCYKLSHISHIPRNELVTVICKIVERFGLFPKTADCTPGPNPIFFGPQIRCLDAGEYVVANCEFYDWSRQSHDSPVRRFTTMLEAVRCFVVSEFPQSR